MLAKKPTISKNSINLIKTIDLYLLFVYNFIMIKSFKDKETELIFNEVFSKKFPTNIQIIALRKLLMINNINDLRIPPSNHLEKLSGDRTGQYSIRINDKWRICFKLENQNDFCELEIVDYH